MQAHAEFPDRKCMCGVNSCPWLFISYIVCVCVCVCVRACVCLWQVLSWVIHLNSKVNDPVWCDSGIIFLWRWRFRFIHIMFSLRLLSLTPWLQSHGDMWPNENNTKCLWRVLSWVMHLNSKVNDPVWCDSGIIFLWRWRFRFIHIMFSLRLLSLTPWLQSHGDMWPNENNTKKILLCVSILSEHSISISLNWKYLWGNNLSFWNVIFFQT